MKKFSYKYGFEIQHVISEKSIDSEGISFSSPHFPSTKIDEDFVKGELFVTFENNPNDMVELVRQGLETTFSLINLVHHPVKAYEIEPQDSLPSLDLRAVAHSTFPLKNPDEVPLIWGKYFTLLLTNKNNISFAINWFMKSIIANDPIDKFVYSWITFNCLYGFLCNADGHIKGIRGLIYNNIPADDIQNEIVLHHHQIFENLASLNLTDKRNGINWSEKLKQSLKTNSTKEIIENGIASIAIVRHSIFHGNIIDSQREAERCIWPLTHINAEVIKNKLLLL